MAMRLSLPMIPSQGTIGTQSEWSAPLAHFMSFRTSRDTDPLAMASMTQLFTAM